MAEPRLFVSHAEGDRDLVENFLRPIRNLPVELAIAGEEFGGEGVRRDLEGQIANSDQVLAVLTDTGAAHPLVNQELGYAVAADIPILPIVTDESNLQGYVSAEDAVVYDETDLEGSAFSLLTELRERLEPIGSLGTPNWFVAFGCSQQGCEEQVLLAIDQPQAGLQSLAAHDELLTTTCEDCGTRYEFNPLTLGFVRSVAPRQQ